MLACSPVWGVGGKVLVAGGEVVAALCWTQPGPDSSKAPTAVTAEPVDHDGGASGKT